MNMRPKENKLNYQKMRALTIGVFALINYLYESGLELIHGASDFQLTQKYEENFVFFLYMTVIIIFRQRYELQVGKKFDLDKVCMGKAIIFMICSVIYMNLLWWSNSWYQNGTNIVFTIAFFVFHVDNLTNTFIPANLEGDDVHFAKHWSQDI